MRNVIPFVMKQSENGMTSNSNRTPPTALDKFLTKFVHNLLFYLSHELLTRKLEKFKTTQGQLFLLDLML